MLTMDLLPASVEEDGFLLFLHASEPRYQPPSHHTIMRSVLPDYYKRVKEEIKGKFVEVKYCPLTTDPWTSRTTQGFIIVTCHFTSNSLELHSVVLHTVHLDAALTAENIST